jgi:hypothetical protein
MSYIFTEFIAARTARTSYRFSTSAGGRYRTRWLWRNCQILDISLEGICITGASRLRKGQKLQIALPVIGELDATVRWSAGETTGCAFASVLDPVLLDAYVLKSITAKKTEG